MYGPLFVVAFSVKLHFPPSDRVFNAGQFWRFHGKNEMEQYGKELRIGRTNGIANRFNEPVRFVGLSRFGDDDW